MSSLGSCWGAPPGGDQRAQHIPEAGILKTQRGTIVLRDREALEAAANGSYGGPEAEYRRLLGEAS